MKYYQLAQFDNVETITKKLQHHLVSYLQTDQNLHTVVQPHEWRLVVPELYEQFHAMNLQPDMIRVFLTAPNKGLPIHIDGSDTIKKVFALNWPVYNSNQCVMSWYKVLNQNLCLVANAKYSPQIVMYTPDMCSEVDRLIIEQPTWVRINVPHSVYNKHTLNRVVVSFRFVPEPYHLLEAELNS